MADFGDGPVAPQDLLSTGLLEVIAYLNRVTGGQLDPNRTSVNPIWERLQEGAGVEEAFLVIDHRMMLWWKDARMKQYIRPFTLFSREKFWEYLELAKRWHADGRPKHEREHEIASQHPDGTTHDELIEDWKERTRT